MTVTFDFTDARVLVTGGTSGIGYGIACAFADAGAVVTVTGTRRDPTEYQPDLTRFAYIQCRMTDHAEIAAVAARFDALDVLVNNAGQNLPGGRSEAEPDVFDEVVAVNLLAANRLSRACHTALAARGGSIVNLASMSSIFGMEIVPGYGAAKAGVVQMTKTLACAWARDGIRVNAVAPGVIETGMTAPMMTFESLTEPLLARTPMQRFGTPADVAPVVLFLASDDAAYITGQTLPVDGGFSVMG
jgi:NAD(P)-dependent dehydrogenase (short-subunit alcohol dehydrogenase family)